MLNVRTGEVALALLRSRRAHVSGQILFAADCSNGVDGEGSGRWLVARRTISGKEAFRVALPGGGLQRTTDQGGGWVRMVQDQDPPSRAGLVF